MQHFSELLISGFWRPQEADGGRRRPHGKSLFDSENDSARNGLLVLEAAGGLILLFL